MNVFFKKKQQQNNGLYNSIWLKEDQNESIVGFVKESNTFQIVGNPCDGFVQAQNKENR